MSSPVGSNESPILKTGHKGVAVLILSLIISLCVAESFTQNYFSNMDKNFFDHIANRFEPSGAFRLAYTRQLLLEHMKKLPINDAITLRFVNDLLNSVPQVEDLAHWGAVDYWASPAEFIASNGGDCEDFVIAKYFALKESGIPAEKMRLAYVKSFQGGKIENHMVLAYYPVPSDEPLLLDNIQPQMLPASKRPDLLPVYEFNGDLSDKFSGPAMRKWGELVEHMNKEFAL
ncbi:transglutaminase-like cysteine peptidase [Sideroxydans sp. CL21]|uniref:transglutaminase-like cysteine peptidase n=1 Tax=Sideroxydans sp. CL21 TaxID=2600596 RepID=UPI0024BC05A2|nr:transglutaminase-like cysteine peptidase [Sideroxydans sp. CL21]